jgi:peptide/nickel transport system permease protein
MNRDIRAGMAGFLLLLVAGAGAPWLAPFDPWAPTVAGQTAPGWPHLLGTNDLGQDLLSEILYGLRLSLLVGLAAAGLSTAVGALVGIVAGTRGGWVDEVMMGVTDTFLLIPGLPLLIVLVAYLGSGFWNLILVIGLIWWTPTARAVRAAALQVRGMPYIEAARATGAGEVRVVLRHVLPNTLPVLGARFVVAVPEAVLTEAGLSFLGLGDPRFKSLGLTLHYAFTGGALLSGSWWWYTFPIAAITLLVCSVALLGLGLEGGQRQNRSMT